MNRNQYIEHLRNVALGLHLEGIQNWADLIVDNLHWVKEKTLTDEEIIEIWSGMETDSGEQNIAFARAILKKAQDK